MDSLATKRLARLRAVPDASFSACAEARPVLERRVPERREQEVIESARTPLWNGGFGAFNHRIILLLCP